MFLMTAQIRVKVKSGNGDSVILKFPASSLSWKISVDNICDTATFIIPALCRLYDKSNHYSNIPTSDNTGNYFKVGDKVEIYAGYDGKNDLQFKGFISKINFTIPLKVDCEGYSYQLKKNHFNKSFGKTTVKDVLNYIITGTDIKISEKMSNRINFEAHSFKNKTGFQVLEFLKEKYLLTVFFEYDKLYVGLVATYKPIVVKHRLHWNVIDSEALFFSTYTGSIVLIEGVSRRADGTLLKVKASNNPNPGTVKQVKMPYKLKADLQLAANRAQDIENQKGFTGEIITFLKPFVRPGMTTMIIDKKFEERNGSYFIESVDGSFGTGGGRQKIGISFRLSANS